MAFPEDVACEKCDSTQLQRIRNAHSPAIVSQWVLSYVIENHRWRQRELADSIKVSESFLSRVRHGRDKLSMHRLLQIAELVHLPLPLLLVRAAQHASPATWQALQNSPEATAVHRVLSQRSNITDDPPRLKAVIDRLQKELVSYKDRLRSSDARHIYRVARVLRLCDEALESPNSAHALLVEVCSCLADRLAYRRVEIANNLIIGELAEESDLAEEPLPELAASTMEGPANSYCC